MFFRFFKPKKKEPEICRVGMEKVGRWVEDIAEKKWKNLDFKRRARTIIEECDVIREKLDALENARLKNENIHPKEKQIMTGNKTSFISGYKLFLDTMPRGVIDDFEAAMGFIEDLEKSMTILNSSTKRSYFILGNFFGDHMQDIRKSLNNVADMLAGMRKDAYESRIGSVKDIKELRDNILKTDKAIIDAGSRVGELEKKIASENKRLKVAKDKIAALKRSEEYAAMKEKEDELALLKGLFSSRSQDFLVSFSLIRKSLGKYERIAYERIDVIKEYIDDPVSALIGDKDAEILLLLEDLGGALGKLNVKDKIEEKTRKSIAYLKDNIGAYAKELREIKGKIKRTNINKEVFEKIKKCERELEDHKNTVGRIKEEKEKIARFAGRDTAELRDELEDALSRFSGLEVRLI